MIVLYQTDSFHSCVKLEENEHATFKLQASISQSITAKLSAHFNIHSGFLLDLVGRLNYWAAVSEVKTDPVQHKYVFGRSPFSNIDLLTPILTILL